MKKRDERFAASEQLAEEIQVAENEREQKKNARMERKHIKEARLRSERNQKLVAPLILFITIILGCLAMLLQARF